MKPDLKKLRELAEKTPHYCYTSNGDGSLDVEYLNALHPNMVIHLLDMIQRLKEGLEFYAQTRRDTSFPGWEKEWRYIEAKSDRDYEYYPNHDVALNTLSDLFGEDNNERSGSRSG